MNRCSGAGILGAAFSGSGTLPRLRSVMRKKTMKPAVKIRSARGFAAAFGGLGIALLILAAWAVPASAEHTRFWRQSDFQEFDTGTAHGVALRSDGKIVLAPKFAPFADPNLAYLWALRVDSKGNLYAAGGTNAKVLRVDPAGKMTSVFESEELTAQALALDKNDTLYVATSPDGKVYRVTPNGQKSVFFDPKAKYIWDLALGNDGTLYVATGDAGKIYAVTPDGKGGEFYTSTETHIRAILLDGKGNLLAGTEPNGLVLRIPLAANTAAAAGAATEKRGAAKADAAKQDAANNANTRSAYVIYETAKKEITALLSDSAGDLYVGAIGDKTRGATPAFPQNVTPPAQQQPGANVQNGQTATITITAGPNPQQPTAFLPFPSLTSSSVYRIAADGSPEEIWTSREDSVYALGLSGDGKLLLGVGNEGSVIELGPDRVFSRLAKTASEQVTAFARAANGKIYIATSNPANVSSLGPDLESEGTFESQSFDARLFSRWGRLTWWGQNAASQNPNVEFYVRAGNTSDPADSWSQWFGPYRDPKGEQTQSPAARFVQWKVVLKGSKAPAPEISWVNLAYLPKNVAPYIDGIAIQDPGVRLSSFGQGQTPSVPVQVHMPPTGSQQAGAGQRPAAEIARFEAPPQGASQKGFQSVIWSSDDPNDDDLVYTIYYHGENDKDWKLLKDKVEQKFYSWDTTSMPDGAYYLKIVASDQPSNPPGQALTTERESERFLVDNTPPQITGLAAEPANAPGDSGTTVRFRAADATSAIVKAQYSVDAGEWTLLLPVGSVSDSPDEHYEFTLHNLAPGEHTVAVRANDQFDNLAAAEVTFSTSAAKK
jgi:hypothetical protein